MGHNSIHAKIGEGSERRKWKEGKGGRVTAGKSGDGKRRWKEWKMDRRKGEGHASMNR